jgi:hypothetical protein
MAKYAGDQVANNPEVVANYLRAAPTTRLATRQIQFLKVHSNSTEFGTQSELPNSNFSKAVRGIQAQAEVVIVGSPNGGTFIIGVYADTMNDGNISDPNHNDNYAYINNYSRTLAQSVNASVGCTDADVDLQVIFGANFLEWNRAINYVDPTATPATIGANYAYQGQSSYENELFTNGPVTP